MDLHLFCLAGRCAGTFLHLNSVGRLSARIVAFQDRFCAARTGYFYDHVFRMIFQDKRLCGDRSGPLLPGGSLAEPSLRHFETALTFECNIFALNDSP
jgi:hypothetical protein